jgi:hypothetical protein
MVYNLIKIVTRYMNELEKEQKVRQVGKTGQGVFYTLK